MGITKIEQLDIPLGLKIAQEFSYQELRIKNRQLKDYFKYRKVNGYPLIKTGKDLELEVLEIGVEEALWIHKENIKKRGIPI